MKESLVKNGYDAVKSRRIWVREVRESEIERERKKDKTGSNKFLDQYSRPTKPIGTIIIS